MIAKYFILFLCFTSLSLRAQFEDYNWILGYLSGFGPHTMHFNFSENELSITNYHSNYKVDHGNAIISTPDGQRIVAMSNGYTIYNHNLDTMVNGGRINYKTAFYSKYGSSIPQIVLILEIPGSVRFYNILYLWFDRPKPDSLNQLNRMYQATIDIDQENGLGRVIASDVLVDDDAFEFGKLQACRHANGRDWWVLIPRRDSKQMLVYLLDPLGIRKSHEVELPIQIKTGIGLAQFSPDGKRYAISQSQDNFRAGAYLELFDFDRCEGMVSNMQSIHVPDTFGSGGLAFSPDSKKLYFGSSKRIYQFDLTQPEVASSRALVGSFGGLIDSFFSGAECKTGPMVLAPDHKIYIATTTGTYWMHTIEYPDSLGAACRFKEGSLHLPSPNTRSVPSYPNFRLGPVDGSKCDSLGIDNIPLALFRYEKNVLNELTIQFRDLSGFQPEKWSWDFGDPNSGVQNYSSFQHVTHTFTTGGVFNVCLRVSNAQGHDELCKTIKIGNIVSTKESEADNINIQILPNPLKDILIINVLDYNPENMRAILIDQFGKIQQQLRLFQGSNFVDMSTQMKGVYFLKIEEKDKRIKLERIVKL